MLICELSIKYCCVNILSWCDQERRINANAHNHELHINQSDAEWLDWENLSDVEVAGKKIHMG